MKTRSYAKSLLAASAFCLSSVGIHAAVAGEVLDVAPIVHVAVAKVESQAQLAEQLRAMGYTAVVLSSIAPSPAIPHPETVTASTSHPENTPVHAGWNGVASKGGVTVQVYADM